MNKGTKIGVIGGGQLAWMLALAAKEMGLSLWVQTPAATDPAVAVAEGVCYGAIADGATTAQLAQHVDVITFENEFVDLEGLQHLENQGVCFYPRLASLAPLLNKYQQRLFLEELGIPVPTFSYLRDRPPSIPCVIKACRHGYDGQGTFVIQDEQAWQQFQQRWPEIPPQGFLVEAFVPYVKELAIMAARSPQGEIALYPVVETQQVAAICRWVIAPAPLDSQVSGQIQQIARQILTALDAVGIFGIEFFLTATGEVLVNEIAPRTHNSGHYTIDACVTSQFQQHLRAISGQPLGSPAMQVPAAVMVNLLGLPEPEVDYAAKREALAALPHANLHWYGKSQAYAGRKLGHVTVLLAQPEAARTVIQQIEAIWYGTPVAATM
ncbi:5-(carboxyamino)imidazole ribonucleotide synthase [Thermosynechococcus sp. HN-54]|uniref:5-(carboxyamino)imidazole ribonucleotide synthase n=1 Tax=Thermosynechococcus sp. HN-54 TaxID=2933959 RepID=UPI00202CEDEC|nr:5-(carboxyamino)imidazole ribonucleotide synthase [Thermosynechococcus sp. HN-54]URR36198.1 5-(carboxyamino)imidazole ribonucleotide synthase [Thermosynechococcus sp. HN-54]